MSHFKAFTVTPSAAEKLTSLRDEHHVPVQFHIFHTGEEYELRVHDKHYDDDWSITVNNITLSFCPRAIEAHTQLTLDCVPSPINDSGFKFILSAKDKTLTTLNGDDVITRITSQEQEVCGAYGEYCYETFS